MSSYRRLVYDEDGLSAVEFLSIRFCCYSSDFECLYLFIIAFLLECSQTPDLIESRGKHAWQNHSEIPVHFEPAYIHLFH